MIGSLKHLVSGRELTAEEETRALILGWCVEWVRTMVAMPLLLVMGLQYGAQTCTSIGFIVRGFQYQR